MRTTLSILLLLGSIAAQGTFKGGSAIGGTLGAAWPTNALVDENFEGGSLGVLTTSCGSSISCTSTNCNSSLDSSFGAQGSSKSLKMEVPTAATTSVECGAVWVSTGYLPATLANGVTIRWDGAFSQTALDHSDTTSCGGASQCQIKLALQRGRRSSSTFNPPAFQVPVVSTNVPGKYLTIQNDYGNVRATCKLSAIARVSNVVTATCASPHGMQTGATNSGVTTAGVADTAFNGSFTATSVTNSTQFTYGQVAGDASSTGGMSGMLNPKTVISALTWYRFELFTEINSTYPTGHAKFWVNGVLDRDYVGTPANPMGGVPISAMTRTSNVLAATVDTVGSNAIQAGDTVTILGNSDSTFNGTCVVAASPAPTTTSFSCPQTGSDGSASNPTGWTKAAILVFDTTAFNLRDVIGNAFGEDQNSSGNWEGTAWIDNVAVAAGSPH